MLFRSVLLQSLVIDERVARDLEQPGAGIVECAEIAALLHRPHEDFLQQIVGQMAIAGAVAQVVAQLALVRVPGAQDAGKGRGAHLDSIQKEIGSALCRSGARVANPELTERYTRLGKKLHLRHLSPDCLELLDKAKGMVELNVLEGPTYHPADNRLG